jgi:xeroderma pigmentosum group C-complementing protein
LCIDYADAVIGFDFKGRHGTAITRGIVAAAEYREALEAVIQGFVDAREEEELTKRSMRALAFWKRFLVALKIKERVANYKIPGEVEVEGKRKELEEVDGEEDTDSESGGGFFPERGVGWLAEPAVGKLLRLKRRRRGSSGDESPNGKDIRGEFLYSESTGSGAAIHGDGFGPPKPLLPPLPANKTSNWYEGGGSGFIPEEEACADTGGGGFLLESGDEGDGHILGGNDATAAAAEGGGFLPNDGSNNEVAGGNFPTSDDAVMTDTHEHTQGPPLIEGSSHHQGGEDSGANLQTHLGPPPPTESHLQPATATTGNASVASTPTDDDDTDDFDRGSLLSHDPEDDDAEPDWLVSD